MKITLTVSLILALTRSALADSAYAPTRECHTPTGTHVGTLTLLNDGSLSLHIADEFYLNYAEYLPDRTFYCENHRCLPEIMNEAQLYPAATVSDEPTKSTGQIFLTGALGEEPVFENFVCRD